MAQGKRPEEAAVVSQEDVHLLWHKIDDQESRNLSNGSRVDATEIWSQSGLALLVCFGFSGSRDWSNLVLNLHSMGIPPWTCLSF